MAESGELTSIKLLSTRRFTGRLPKYRRTGTDWPGKECYTFSDAVSTVRAWRGDQWVFRQTPPESPVEKLPPHWRQFLLDALARTG
jgi:hypothetical protein